MKKSLYIICVFAFAYFDAKAQDMPFPGETYSFVDYSHNHIRFFKDSSAYKHLFNRFDTLLLEGKGKINIVHIGGSHVQADIWSDRIRTNFYRYFPGTNGGRGFIFPFRVAKTNNPYYFYPDYTGNWEACRNVETKKSCTLGLSGISLTTFDTSSNIKIRFRGEQTPRYTFNRIKVFHAFDSLMLDLCLGIADSLFTFNMYPDKGYTEFILSERMDTLLLTFIKTDTSQRSFTLYGITLENDDDGFSLHAIGVNGASVPSYLRCMLFEKQLAELNPDLVILSIGINDAYEPGFDPLVYESNYDSLLSRIKRAAPNTAILFTTNNDSYYKKKYPNRNGELVKQTMFLLSEKHRAGVWDMFSVMGGLGASKHWQKMGMIKPDKVHFTKEGYELIGDLLFNALMKAYDVHLGNSAKLE